MGSEWAIRHIGVTYYVGPINGVIQTQSGYFFYDSDDFVKLSEHREYQLFEINEQVYELIHKLFAEHETPRYPNWWPFASGGHCSEGAGLVYRTVYSLLEEKGELIGVASGKGFPFGNVVIQAV